MPLIRNINATRRVFTRALCASRDLIYKRRIVPGIELRINLFRENFESKDSSIFTRLKGTIRYGGNCRINVEKWRIDVNGKEKEVSNIAGRRRV